MATTRISIPKEHGAYIVLISSWIAGLIFAGFKDVGFSVLLMLPVTSFFLLEPNLRDTIRTHGIRKEHLHPVSLLLLLLGIGSAVYTSFVESELIWFYAAYLIFGILYGIGLLKRWNMTTLSIIGFCALSLLTPMTFSASTQTHTFRILFPLWSYVLLFFCSSALCINVRLTGRRALPLSAPLIFGAAAILYIEVYNRLLPQAALYGIALRVIEIVGIIALTRHYIRLSLKTIGILESIIAVMFLLIHLFIR